MTSGAIEGLQAEYGSRVAADLQQNAEEHERIAAQLAELQTRLEAVERERHLLLNLQEALSGTEGRTDAVSRPAQAPAQARAAKVPRSRKAQDSGDPGRPAGRARRKPAAGKKSAAQKKSAANKAPAAQKQPEAAVKVTDLVEGCLVENGKPQSAAEVAAAVSTKERPVTVVSVRTALEGLVRKSSAYRSKQGRAVYYEAVAKDGSREPEEDGTPAAAGTDVSVSG